VSEDHLDNPDDNSPDVAFGGENAQAVEEQGYPYRMYLGALQRDDVRNADGSYSVTYFRALPDDISGDPLIALGGHPAWEYRDADGVTDFDRAAAVSAVFYPGGARQFAVDSDNCNACHERIQFHGSNRNGNAEICLACHTADTAGDRSMTGSPILRAESPACPTARRAVPYATVPAGNTRPRCSTIPV
jgi:hypothetical protein